ncbi:MAG TPA: helix-turn-helix transcriptional regulator [Propionibacteriaceae bacterium]
MTSQKVTALSTAASLQHQAVREIKSLMARYGITQAEIAVELGLSQPAISSRFTGVTPMTIDEMDKIARLLGVKPAQLLGGVPFGGPPLPDADVTRRYGDLFTTESDIQLGIRHAAQASQPFLQAA